MSFGRAGESIFHLGGREQKEIFLIYMKLMTNMYLSGPDSLSTPIHNHCIFVFLTSGFCFLFFYFYFLVPQGSLGVICSFTCK